LIERVLLGDNPFIGVNHLSQDRARETLARLNSNRIADVIATAFANGADGFVFSTHPANLEVLRLLKDEHPELAFDMYPLLPYAQGYVRVMNEKGTMALFTEFMNKLSAGGKVKALVGGGLSALTMNPYKMLSTFVDAEVEGFLRASNGNNRLQGVFLHEIVVDLACALRMKELFQNYIGHIKDAYHLKAGLVTRNFPYLISYLKEIGQDLNEVVFMTPFNKAGFQMNPSKTDCEKILMDQPRLDVIAMSVFAAGLIGLNDAVDYAKSLPNLRSVVVGVSREEHARTTFRAFRNVKGTNILKL
jgi:hypothetical protein